MGGAVSSRGSLAGGPMSRWGYLLAAVWFALADALWQWRRERR